MSDIISRNEKLPSLEQLLDTQRTHWESRVYKLSSRFPNHDASAKHLEISMKDLVQSFFWFNHGSFTRDVSLESP